MISVVIVFGSWKCVNDKLRGTAVLGTEYTSGVNAVARRDAAAAGLLAASLCCEDLVRGSTGDNDAGGAKL